MEVENKIRRTPLATSCEIIHRLPAGAHIFWGGRRLCFCVLFSRQNHTLPALELSTFFCQHRRPQAGDVEQESNVQPHSWVLWFKGSLGV